MFEQGFTCPALLEDQTAFLPVRDCHPLWCRFPSASGSACLATGLVRVRSSLLAESLLMSFPPATEIFQFAGFAAGRYGFTAGYRLRGGLPHSEIRGSTGARPFPRLFAACHVLHRLSVPRHPPNALIVARPRPAQSQWGEPPCLGFVCRLSAAARPATRPLPAAGSGTMSSGLRLKHRTSLEE